MSEYIPQEEWKTLNALDGFGRNSIPATDRLAGETLRVAFEDGSSVIYAFALGGRLRWRDASSEQECEEECIVREVLDDVFLVDFTLAQTPSRAVVLVIDRPRSLVTRVTSDVDLDRSVAVEERVAHGLLPGGERGDRHERTDATVDNRVRYVYDDEHEYEHIYLNDTNYCWHCLKGPEAGQADVDPATAYEIRERVYLLCWREHVVPCDGIVVIDWVNMRNNGRIFGWDTEEQAFNSIRMGAHAVAVTPIAARASE
jgi:hypothetical protein